MALDKDTTGWETEADVDACLRELGVSHNQMARWRQAGLLPGVKQLPNAYRGSAVIYPAGTCAQLCAAARLFALKNRVEFVGRELWWDGFDVDERYWRPHLIRTAKLMDLFRPAIRHLLDTHDDQETGVDKIVAQRTTLKNFIFSRITRRVSDDQLASVFRVIFETSTGRFDGFEAKEGDDNNSHDETATLRALDLERSKSDSIDGQRLKLAEELEPSLRALSSSAGAKSWTEIANGDAPSLGISRNDARNALLTSQRMHDSLSWIYGPGAFGLRFLFWLAKKIPDDFRYWLTLGVALLRQNSNNVLTSKEIELMATKADAMLAMSMQLRELGKTDPRFRNLFTPRRLRLAFRDRSTYETLLKEVEIARNASSWPA